MTDSGYARNNTGGCQANAESVSACSFKHFSGFRWGEAMSDFEKKDREWSGSNADSGSGGATGIFGTVPEQSSSSSPSVEETAAPPVTPVVPATEPQKSPNVHEIVFHAPGSGTPGHTDSLRRILESSPPPAVAPQVTVPSAPGGAGFTQLLRALTPADLAAKAPPSSPSAAPPQPTFSAPQNSEVPQAFTPPASATPAPSSSPSPTPSFTQVFSAIESPAPKSAPATTPAPQAPEAKASSSFTQMFAAISEPQANAASAVPNPQVAEAFTPPPQRSAPPPMAPTSAPSSSPGGFTQMFQALDPKASNPALASEEPQGFQPAEPAPLPPAPAPTSQAVGGGFTQMFQALDPAPKPSATTAPPVAPTPAAKATPAPAPSAGITQLLKAFDGGTSSKPEPSPTIPAEVIDLGEIKPLAATPKPAVTQDPGSFTQIFQASPSAPKATPSSIPSAPPAPPVSSSPAPASGGSFTQLFSTLDKGYSPTSAANQMPADVDPFARNASPGAQASPHAPSQGIGSTPAGSSPGSFTQIFSASSMQPKGPTNQADNFPPVAPAGHTPGSFTPEGMPPGFSTPQAPLGSGFGASSSPSFSSSSPATSTPSASPSGGGLTQLLRTLDAPGAPLTATKAPEAANAFSGSGAAPSAYGAVTPAATGPASAPQSLTQQFSAMNAAPPPAAASPQTQFGAPGMTPNSAPAGATTAFKIPPAAQTTPPPPQQSGPGEYTRIIQASQFRESAAQGGSHGGMPPAGGAPASGGGMKSPIQFTPGSVSMPQMGGGSIGGGSLGGGSMGGGSLGGGSMGGGSMGGMNMGSASAPHMGMPGMGMPSVGLPSAQIPSAQLKMPPMGGSPQPPAAPGAAPKSSMTMIIIIIALVLVVAILLAVLLLKK